MLLLIILSYIDPIYYTGSYNTRLLKAGKYTIHCYGAQGGRSHNDGKLSKYGGRGAYTKGTITITGSGTWFYFNVGGQGISNRYGDQPGGFNGGGRSGRDKGSGMGDKKGNEGGGSGGGATDVRIGNNEFSSRVMVAAGGSGATTKCDGAPGGDLNGRTMSKNDVVSTSSKVTQTEGNSNGIGGDGVDSKLVPGSGGGGGWRGGIRTSWAGLDSTSYKATAHSGSSYISGHPGCQTHSLLSFTSTQMTAGVREGHGYVSIEVEILCPDHCHSCTSNDNCLKCLDNYLLSYDSKECLSECPEGYYDGKNGKCEKCSSNCKTCVDSPSKCTSCSDPKALYDNKCNEECPSHYTPIENVCQKCEGCEECSGTTTTCTKCGEGFFLQGDKCVDKCYDGYIGFDRVCYQCDSNCSNCFGSASTCESCKEGFSLYFYQCVKNCPSGYTRVGEKCEKCHYTCSECEGSTDKCTACSRGYYLLNNKCQLECDEGFFGNSERQCEKCSENCKGCEYSSETCTSCKAGSALYNNQCVEKCPQGTGNINGVCQSCVNASCSQCDGDITKCSGCFNGYKLVDGGVCEYQCNIPTASPSYSPSYSPTASAMATPSFSPTASAVATPSFSPTASPSDLPTDSVEESTTSSSDDSEADSKVRLFAEEKITCYDCPLNCSECSSSTQCTVCEEGLIFYNYDCVTSCPKGTTVVNNACVSCSSLNCESCDDDDSKCTKCKEGLVLFNNKCRHECPIGYINISGVCEECDGNCFDCIDEKTKCTSCKPGFNFDENENENKCQSSECKDGFVPFDGKCEKCADGCSSCEGAKTNCTSCVNGKYLHHNQCIDICPKGYTSITGGDNVCVQCIGCEECAGSPTKCNNCPSGLFMNEAGVCVNDCGPGKFGAQKKCLPCLYPCSECIGDAKTCTACAANYSLVGDECWNGCPPGMVSIEGVCKQCTSNCETCENTQSECLTCIEGFNLLGRKCITDCPPGMVGLERRCENCTSPCSECFINQTFCTKCIENYLFYENQCYEVCPYNTIQQGDICVKCDDSCYGCFETTTKCINCTEGYFRFGDYCYADCSSVNNESIPVSVDVIYYGNNYETYTCDECVDKECTNCMNNYSVCVECLPGLLVEKDACYPPEYVYIEDKNCTQDSRCGITVRKDKNVQVVINVTNFTNIIEPNNGGAFYIINSGINCTRTMFYNITSGGGGGAIYVKNWKNLVNNVFFDELYFVICKALYGGAVYTYSSGESNVVSIKKCRFYSNEVDPVGGKTLDGKIKLVGGNALFVSAKNADVKKCFFDNNRGSGSAVKIFNRFENPDELDESIVIIKRKNNENEGARILFSDCQLKISRKEKNSIFVEGNELSNLEIRDCKFAGKLPKGAKYIGGKVISKNIPKIQVNNCQFETKGKSTMSFEIVDDDLF